MNDSSPIPEHLASSGIDERDLDRLEFDAVRRHLAQHAASEGGRALALSLAPADAKTARERLEALAEAKARAAEHGDGPTPGVHSVASSLEKARAGRRLEGTALWQLGALLGAAAVLRRHWSDPPVRAARTRAALARLVPLDDLERVLARSVAEDGSLLDGASRTLGQLRERLRGLQRAARERLERLSRALGSEGISTVREDRYVLSLRADRFDRSRGIVQDVSASGVTLFVEPFELVPVNNELREVAAAAGEEERRILDELTARVAERAEELAGIEAGVAELDELMARVRLSRALLATTPGLEEGCERLRLRAARHPLLWLQEGGAVHPEGARRRVVPFDLELSAPGRVLLVSGPNMGGKTVLLKAVGLAVVMALAGLDVCAAEGAVLPAVRRVLTDVGDQQSLADHLSTFAGRCLRLDAMIRAAEPATLCLVDELGSGTDPEEGTALGRALLEHLGEHGAWAVATTHLGGLKVLAAERPQVVNASLAIDAGELRPLYELQVGVPGASYGLATARRLGLAEPVLARAEAALADGALGLERLLAELALELRWTKEQRERLLAREREWEARSAAEGALREAARTREEERLERQLAELQVLEARARELVRQADREWRRAGEAGTARQTAALRGAVREIAAESDRHRAALRGTPAAAPVGELAAGQQVRHRGLALDMQVVEGPRPDGSVVLARGAWRVTARPEELAPAAGGPGGTEATGRTPLHQVRVERAAPWEVDLRGQFVDEALRALDTALDRAVLAGHAEFRVIHGVGSGALERAVRHHLQGHALVKAHRLGGHGEGGRGVTVVELA